MKLLFKIFFPISLAVSLVGCSSTAPITTVDKVDIKRFMGKWYVIANIPTFLEEGAHNAIESYKLTRDGHIATTFTFRDSSFNGPLKKYEPTGFIVDKQSNAVWDMQFIWPFKAEYRVIYLSPDYEVTIIGRSKRDYVWLMARKPELKQTELVKLFKFIEQQGYDATQLQMVPQSWPETSAEITIQNEVNAS